MGRWSKNRLVGLTIILASLILPALLHDLILNPSNPPLCPFKAITGVPCPSCGIGRAFASVTHGEMAQATEFHPISIPLYLLCIILAIKIGGELITRKPVFPKLQFGQKYIWPVFFGILIFQIYRTYIFISTEGIRGILNNNLLVRCFKALGSFFS